MPVRPLALAVLVSITGCATSRVHTAAPSLAATADAVDVAHTVLLAGGLGDLADPSVMEALAADALAAGPLSTVVVLGDLTSAAGPDDSLPTLARALAGYRGRVVIVPGDLDWQRGPAAVQALAARLDAALEAEVVLPAGADGALLEIDLTDSFRLVAVDTAWWLRDDSDGRSALADELGRLVRDRDDEQLLVVGHHAVRSNGASDGHVPAGRGALSLGVAPLLAQAAPAPRRARLRRALVDAFGEHERLVYAAGDDRSLQAHARLVNGDRHAQTFLVSGSAGGAARATVGGRGARLAAGRAGYWRLRYHADGTLVGEAVAVDPERRVLWRTGLSGPDPRLVPDRLPDHVAARDLPAGLGGRRTQPSDGGFATGPFRLDALTRALAGDGYRDAWAAPVSVPVLDLGAERGGLTPLRRGGGNQTTSLRLRAADGHDYDLRLVEKGGEGGLPEPLRDGIAGDVVLDLRSAALPYAAAVTAELVRAAGVRTPRPRAVYVPDDPRLGRYRGAFGGRLALLEVQPDDDMSDLPGWEGVTDVVSAQKLREELREDQDHAVDQRAFLRARLVELVVADWDRHAGQFRWAAYEPGDLDPALSGDAATKGKVYQPVPGDYDWALYDLGGLAQRALFQADRRYQPLRDHYGSVLGLTQTARFQDRRFLNALTAGDVQAVALEVQAALSDDAIERALATLPPGVGVADRWRQALRGRRDRLPQAARRLYDLVSRDVDVVGSDQREAFVVEPSEGALTVSVHALGGDAVGRLLYRRTFLASETREVRLHGLGGRDRFDLRPGASAVALRVVGGDGLDTVASAQPSAHVYDTPDGVRVSGRARLRLGTTPDVHRYDEDAPYRTVRRVAPILAVRPTDGVLLGATMTVTTQGFRRRPFAARHTLSADVATSTGGVRASYAGRYTRERGPGLLVDLLGATPRVARNLYGVGNGTPPQPADAVRLSVARVEATAALAVAPGPRLLLAAGPTVRYADASADPDRPPGPLLRLPGEASRPQTHAGVHARLRVSTVDVPANPRQGVRVSASADALGGASGPADAYAALGAEVAAFVPLRLAPQLTLALRLGADHRLGTPPLYDLAVLGQGRGLRGYRAERFSGRTALAGTAEARVRLATLPTYLAPLAVGALAFADGGRVWTPDGFDVSGAPGIARAPGGDVHVGYGGGLWVGALDRAVLVLSAQRSPEETLVTFGLGFAF